MVQPNPTPTQCSRLKIELYHILTLKMSKPQQKKVPQRVWTLPPPPLQTEESQKGCLEKISRGRSRGRSWLWLPEGPPVSKFFQKTLRTFYCLKKKTFWLINQRGLDPDLPYGNSEQIFWFPIGKSNGVKSRFRGSNPKISPNMNRKKWLKKFRFGYDPPPPPTYGFPWNNINSVESLFVT